VECSVIHGTSEPPRVTHLSKFREVWKETNIIGDTHASFYLYQDALTFKPDI